jgi:hypothetical protein
MFADLQEATPMRQRLVTLFAAGIAIGAVIGLLGILRH